MPHIVVQCSGRLAAETDLNRLCRSLADALIAQHDDAGTPVFPVAGIRVLAMPAPQWAVADGQGDPGFVYINLRMARGRAPAVRQRTGEALTEAARAHFADLQERRHFGITIQIDEGNEVFGAKIGNLHGRTRKVP